MRSTNKERLQTVKAACAKFKDLPSMTLARVIYKKHRHWFPTLAAANSAIRYQRGNAGNVHRKRIKDSPLARPNGKCGFTWEFPRSSAPSYAPLHLDEPRTLILSDIHIPFHDRAAIEAVIHRAKRADPTCILLNGDVCDFFSISRFDKNPTESSLKKELDLTRQFLGWLKQQFPKARLIYKLGNHDEWFDKYLFRKAPELYGVSGVSLKHLTTAKIDSIEPVEDVEWVDDQQKIMIGKLNIYHGHELGKGSIAPPVNPARGLFMRTIECGLQGHLHKDSQHSETSANGKLISTWSTGCLCGLYPRYARINKWTHSAAMVDLSGGQFGVETIRLLNGKVL